MIEVERGGYGAGFWLQVDGGKRLWEFPEKKLTFRLISGNIVGQPGEVAQRWSSGLISHWFWVQIPASPSFYLIHLFRFCYSGLVFRILSLGSVFTPRGYCANPSLAIFLFNPSVCFFGFCYSGSVFTPCIREF